MIVKVQLALAFQEQKRIGSARHDPTYNARQQKFHAEMRVLNERGLNNRKLEFGMQFV